MHGGKWIYGPVLTKIARMDYQKTKPRIIREEVTDSYVCIYIQIYTMFFQPWIAHLKCGLKWISSLEKQFLFKYVEVRVREREREERFQPLIHSCIHGFTTLITTAMVWSCWTQEPKHLTVSPVWTMNLNYHVLMPKNSPHGAKASTIGRPWTSQHRV